MKCLKCGKDWSDSVYPFHVKRCQANPDEIKEDPNDETPEIPEAPENPEGTPEPEVIEIPDIQDEPEEDVPEAELTKGLIIVALNRMDVDYDPLAERDDLLQLLKDSKKGA